MNIKVLCNDSIIYGACLRLFKSNTENTDFSLVQTSPQCHSPTSVRLACYPNVVHICPGDVASEIKRVNIKHAHRSGHDGDPLSALTKLKYKKYKRSIVRLKQLLHPSIFG